MPEALPVDLLNELSLRLRRLHPVSLAALDFMFPGENQTMPLSRQANRGYGFTPDACFSQYVTVLIDQQSLAGRGRDINT